ncbi:glycosyltransferase [Flavobacterium commune]|uniref:glycosyltransferase n=1 Tax=Flavobacterium commune TaxID=1306519 RepID=UPI0018DE7A0B|nr:glycosyltransferase [Flavobacterium commune]
MLSIIVPVYNVADYLGRCLESITVQITDGVEVILIDDGSTDMSYAICTEFEKRFEYIRVVRQHNKGLSGARNTGMDYAQGDFVWFIDSDDWIVTGAVPKLLDYIRKSPEIDVFRFGFTLFKDETDEPVEEYVNSSVHDVKSNSYFQQNEMMYQVWAGIYKCTFLEKNSISFPEGMIYEDIPYNLQVYTSAARMTVLSHKFYWYRVRQGSLLRSEVNLKKIVSVAHILGVCDTLIDKFEGNNKEVTIAIRKKLDYLYVYIDHLHAYNGFTSEEKWKAFQKLNLHIPILPGESKGLIWKKLQLRWMPKIFYKNRIHYLKKQSQLI